MTTVLLAMLHRGGDARRRALDFLFNPRGEPVLDLIELFDRLRWWHVVRRYLPEPLAERAPFWVWADEELEAFQLDVLRDGYLLYAYADRDRSPDDATEPAARN